MSRARWAGKLMESIKPHTEVDGATPSLTAIKTNLIMSRVSEAMSAIDEALRLGNITEEMATNLKNHPFENSAEFDELYNLAMSLNSADCNTIALEKFS